MKFDCFFVKKMKKASTLLLLTLVLYSLSSTAQSNFLNFQKKHEAVVTAIQNKEDLIVNKLIEKNITLNELNILIVAYKYEQEVVLFGKNKADTKYQKLETYKICHLSGLLGPKRKHRDGQVPEGFYNVDRFNPKSNYHLSFGINYPNLSDKIKSNASHLGGNIFFLGACVTIGCLPMTDDKIEEIYTYTINAKSNGQKEIPVYIFPFKMNDETFKQVKINYSNKPQLINFWNNIKIGYDMFHKKKQTLNFSINDKGDYLFK